MMLTASNVSDPAPDGYEPDRDDRDAEDFLPFEDMVAVMFNVIAMLRIGNRFPRANAFEPANE
jgi:hypothetical protein